MTIDEHYAELCHIGWTSTREVFDYAYKAGLADAAAICAGVNNFDNPMTANDCVDAIRALGEAK
jgi:hypothetical protein